jgi:hypothetical protein
MKNARAKIKVPVNFLLPDHLPQSSFVAVDALPLFMTLLRLEA